VSRLDPTLPHVGTGFKIRAARPTCGDGPFAPTLGIEPLSASAEEVVGRLGWRAELFTTGGALHGGALMSLADNLGGVCAHLNPPSRRRHRNDLVLDETMRAFATATSPSPPVRCASGGR
jgi:hypothetical protein